MADYKAAREAFGLSRDKLSNLAKRAGIRVSPQSIKKLEDEGEKAVGSRGLTPDVVGYLNYVLGIGEFDATDWSQVEKGAPVIVAGEKGTFAFVAVNDDGSIQVFADNFRNFAPDKVRLVAPTALPPEGSEHLFTKRTRGSGGRYAEGVLNYVQKYPNQPHGVGAIAVALGWDNGVVSRTVAALVKAGKLQKVGRGVVTLPGQSDAPAPSQGTQSDAEWEASAKSPGDETPSF